jgi:hypothetical protein
MRRCGLRSITAAAAVAAALASAAARVAVATPATPATTRAFSARAVGAALGPVAAWFSTSGRSARLAPSALALTLASTARTTVAVATAITLRDVSSRRRHSAALLGLGREDGFHPAEKPGRFLGRGRALPGPAPGAACLVGVGSIL